MNKIICLAIIIVALVSTATAGDLYKVTLKNQAEAEILRSTAVEPALVLADGYLVLADAEASRELGTSGLTCELVTTDVAIDELAVDHRFDRENVKRHSLVYEEGGLRVYRVSPTALAQGSLTGDLTPLDTRFMKIEYRGGSVLYESAIMEIIDYDSLIGLVSQDSLLSYTERLQAYLQRVTGTDSCNAARDWIAAKFASFGYDSIAIDTFPSVGGHDGYNVVAYKIGSLYPDRHIVVGGHFDGVINSPAADDNGSGTAGTLEIARVLKDVETEKTIIFIAFDAEEVGLIGSAHYASQAAARGDTIEYMLNMDMIAYYTNDDTARLYFGPEIAYSQLWGQLAKQHVGITGVLIGSSGSSDHAPFIQNGYPATFVHEYDFSTVYHSNRDSTTYMNFDYMTRMVQASLATVYTVDFSLPTVYISSLRDGGDGQSIQVNWTPSDPAQVDYYRLYWTTVPASQPDSVELPVENDTYLLTGLTEDQEYSFYIVAFDNEGRSSFVAEQVTGTPSMYPAQPKYLRALPVRDAIELSWFANNTELDFDHYTIVRDDAVLSVEITDLFYVDDDPLLGSDLHDYFVRAVDTGGLMSDTIGVEPISMKAATLQAGRILAVNRSGKNSAALVEEGITGSFLEEALTDLNFDYLSDTAYSTESRTRLADMVDYSLMIIGAEGGRQDDIGDRPEYGGILDTVIYYLSIGGKVIIFGRWGDLDITPNVDTVYFTPGESDFAYTDYFNIGFRVRPLTLLEDNLLKSDLSGAKSQVAEYPDLVWDSSAAFTHSAPFGVTTGIPCPTVPVLAGAPVEIIYTYDSYNDSSLTEDKPLAWRYTGGEHEFVFFELPLSFMERSSAVAALRQAVADMGIPTAVDETADNGRLPRDFTLAQNYPNPFNPATSIEFYNPDSRPVMASLEVFNIIGQRVRLLFDGQAAPGANRFEWDGLNDAGREAASGIYFYRLKTEKSALTRKMLLLR